MLPLHVPAVMHAGNELSLCVDAQVNLPYLARERAGIYLLRQFLADIIYDHKYKDPFGMRILHIHDVRQIITNRNKLLFVNHQYSQPEFMFYFTCSLRNTLLILRYWVVIILTI